MRLRNAATAIVALLLLGGCATYDYRGTTAGGGYYSGRSVQPSYGYGAVYGSAGYGYYGGYGYGGYGYSAYNPYWAGYYPRPVYRPPAVIVRPGRPGHGRPPVNRPSENRGAPWRNLQDVQRPTERARPGTSRPPPSGVRPPAQGRPAQTVPARPAGQRPAGQRPVRPATAPNRSVPAARPAGQTRPVRPAASPRQSTVQTPLRVSPAPAAARAVAAPRQTAAPPARPVAAAAPVRQPMRVNATRLNAQTDEP